jgi:hypothetical protein
MMLWLLVAVGYRRITVMLVSDLSVVQSLLWLEGHCVAPVDMPQRDLSELRWTLPISNLLAHSCVLLLAVGRQNAAGA